MWHRLVSVTQIMNKGLFKCFWSPNTRLKHQTNLVLLSHLSRILPECNFQTCFFTRSSGNNVWLRPIRFFRSFYGLACWLVAPFRSRIDRGKWTVLTSRAASNLAATHVSDKVFELLCDRDRIFLWKWKGGGEELKESYSCNHKLRIHSFTVRNDLSFCFWQDQKGNFFGLCKLNRL